MGEGGGTASLPRPLASLKVREQGARFKEMARCDSWKTWADCGGFLLSASSPSCARGPANGRQPPSDGNSPTPPHSGGTFVHSGSTNIYAIDVATTRARAAHEERRASSSLRSPRGRADGRDRLQRGVLPRGAPEAAPSSTPMAPGKSGFRREQATSSSRAGRLTDAGSPSRDSDRASTCSMCEPARCVAEEDQRGRRRARLVTRREDDRVPATRDRSPIGSSIGSIRPAVACGD